MTSLLAQPQTLLPRLRRLAKGFRVKPSQRGINSHTILLPAYQTIYFYIPKVACSSLKLVCANWLGLEIPKGKTIHQIDFPYVRRADLGQYTDYFKFAFVRNPWDRLVSCYHNKIKPEAGQGDPRYYIRGVFKDFVRYNRFRAGMPFSEFVAAIVEIPDSEADSHFRSQYTFLTDPEGQLLVNYVGKMETLPQDFAEVCRRMGVERVPLPHLMKSAAHHYQQAYNPTLQAQVKQRYARDVELFGYEF